MALNLPSGRDACRVATPVPKERAGLRTGGLYRFTRHPIYTGVLLFVVGTVVTSGSGWKLAVGVLTVVFFNVKARWEESQLRAAIRGTPRVPSALITGSSDRCASSAPLFAVISYTPRGMLGCTQGWIPSWLDKRLPTVHFSH